MKKFSYVFIAAICMLLAGCFETTQEITINKDGSGFLVNTTDFSNMIGLIKQMGGDEASKMKSADTTISLVGVADSISGITQIQKEIVNRGTMKLTLNMEDEKLIIKLNFPFQKVSDIKLLQEILPRVSEATLKKMPGTDQVPAGMGNEDSAKLKTFDDYFDVTFTDKLIKKTVNKDKYATAASDQYMKSLKQMSGMGSPVTANYIFYLPRPAKKVEGKAVKLSPDKKKVTISVTSDDFFDDPSKFEFTIQY